MEVVATIATTLAATYDKGAEEVLIRSLILRKARVAIYAIGRLGNTKPLDRRIEARNKFDKASDVGLVRS